jgi:hypothetical protein
LVYRRLGIALTDEVSLTDELPSIRIKGLLLTAVTPDFDVALLMGLGR